jgi:hypothetical protein
MRLDLQTAEFRATSRIDAAGLVTGVSVMTVGEAEGHDVWVDQHTLETVRRTAAQFAGGVKTKAEHSYGLDKIIGACRNFRLDGSQLRADLQLIRSHPAYNFIRELIEKQPSTFGLSISFSYVPEKIDNKVFVRVEDLYSVDLVERPACNPGGLFSTGPKPSGFMKQDIAKLTAAFIAIEGPGGARRIQGLPFEQKVDLMERSVYFNNISIPGYSFEHVQSKWGDRKAAFGLRRIEIAAKQDSVDKALARL